MAAEHDGLLVAEDEDWLAAEAECSMMARIDDLMVDYYFNILL